MASAYWAVIRKKLIFRAKNWPRLIRRKIRYFLNMRKKQSKKRQKWFEPYQFSCQWCRDRFSIERLCDQSLGVHDRAA